MRGIATNVPLSVATALVPSASLKRIFKRRAWNSVQLEVLVTSRYAFCVGIYASISNLRFALDPRSPDATSITR